MYSHDQHASPAKDPKGPQRSTKTAGRRLGVNPATRRWDPAGVLALQRTVGNAVAARLIRGDGDETSPVHEVLRGAGQPLDGGTRTAMEARFGQGFGDVRIHTGSAAEASCRSVQASAYTVGSDIVVGASQAGASQRTLAHELTHVVQQRSGPVSGTPAPGGIKVSDPSDRFEREAERVADMVTSSPGLAAVSEVPATTGTVTRMAAVQRADKYSKWKNKADKESKSKAGRSERLQSLDFQVEKYLTASSSKDLGAQLYWLAQLKINLAELSAHGLTEAKGTRKDLAKSVDRRILQTQTAINKDKTLSLADKKKFRAYITMGGDSGQYARRDFEGKKIGNVPGGWLEGLS
ncbi:MAG: DUF4157 domain-containing protein, partial [Pseudonocardiaceae bacterium]